MLSEGHGRILVRIGLDGISNEITVAESNQKVRWS